MICLNCNNETEIINITHKCNICNIYYYHNNDVHHLYIRFCSDDFLYLMADFKLDIFKYQDYSWNLTQPHTKFSSIDMGKFLKKLEMYKVFS